MKQSQRAALALLCALVAFSPALPQEPPQNQGTPEAAPPTIPSLESVRAQKEAEENYIPLDLHFRIGLVGDHPIELQTTTGPQLQIKTPLILIDPATGEKKKYAENFPTRVVASSPNGVWVVGIAPSAGVEGSSGSRDKECAVSLNLDEGKIRLIVEFPRFSSFQALFAPSSSEEIYYCANEPGAVNQIVRYNLASAKVEPLPAEGNRFYLYGLKTSQPQGIWVQDPMRTDEYPVLCLLDMARGDVLSTVEFPGARDVFARPGGDTLVAEVMNGAEGSLGYYDTTDQSFHQVPQLVLTRPSLKWAHKSLAVVAKETTTARDRFLWIDLASGTVRELFSAYFKVAFWDISPDDDALVFVTDSRDSPVVFVIPTDPKVGVINRIPLHDVRNVSWLGCLYPAPQRGSWLQRLMPF